MLANGASQRQRLRLRLSIERLIADVVGRFIGRFLRRQCSGVALHHHEGVHATVTPARRQAHRTHVKALPLTGRESTMAFLALLMAAPWYRCGRDVLALREHKRLGLFDLDDILATGLMNLGCGVGIAVMCIECHLVRLEMGVRSQGAHHRNFTGFAALQGGVGQEGPGGMTDREDHGLLVPRGKRPSQHLPIDGDPAMMRTQLHLHANIPVDQCV